MDKIQLANEIIEYLKSYYDRIEIAGSIRRGCQNPSDIDLVVVSGNKLMIDELMNSKGIFNRGGNHISVYNINGMKVEIYFTNEESWGAALLTRTGSAGHNIGLRMIAKKMGMKLNEYGLWKDDINIASRSEEDIYGALGRIFKQPEERD